MTGSSDIAGEMLLGLLPVSEATAAAQGTPDTIPAGEGGESTAGGIVRSDSHTCLVCGGGAVFGFATRQGASVWTCMTHRSEGERVLVAPAPFSRNWS